MLLFKVVIKNIQDLKPLMNHFNLAGKCQSDNFKFWLEYCEMVDLLLNFLAAERDSDWELHLETFQEMLPTTGHMITTNTFNGVPST